MASAKILIADDNPDNVDLVSDILSPHGYEIVIARDGVEAIELSKVHHPDLILLDVNMPRADGYEVLRQVKGNPGTSDIAVLMLTALVAVPDRVKGLSLGADDYLTKPFHHHELLARVRARLRIKALEDELRQRINTLYGLFHLYVPTRVAQLLIEEPNHAMLGGARREITILFADLHGFTALSETSKSEDVLDLLNFYLTLAADAIFAEEGTLDKFMGDAAMAIFNAPLAQPDHILRAARAALAIQQRAAAYPRPAHIPALDFRIGIHTGDAVVGNIGSNELLNYTAVGDPVNLAKRLQETAEPKQVLLSRAAYERIQSQVQARPLGVTVVRGRHQPVEVYELLQVCG